jgi:hypothetical protein
VRTITASTSPNYYIINNKNDNNNMAKKTIERLLTEKVATLQKEVETSQALLAEAEKQLDDYNSNKAVIETILALQSGEVFTPTVPYTGKRRGRKPRTV